MIATAAADCWAVELINAITSPTSTKPGKTISTNTTAEMRAAQHAYRCAIRCSCVSDEDSQQCTTTTTNNNATTAQRAACAASPWCHRELLQLSTDPAQTERCLLALHGSGPALRRADVRIPASPDTMYSCSDEDVHDVLHESTNTLSVPLWRGIINLGATCYFNVIVQLLFSIAPIRRAILAELSSDNTTTNNDNVAVANFNHHTAGLDALFADMAFGRGGDGANSQHVIDHLGLMPDVQQDAQELLILLTDWLQSQGRAEVRHALSHTFGGMLLYHRVCSHCGRGIKKAEHYRYVSLPLCATLEQSMEEMLQSEEVEGFVCEGCGEVGTATSHQFLRTLPDVLLIQLQRFHYDLATVQRKKKMMAVSFPATLDMSQHARAWSRHQQQQQGSSTSPPPGDDTEAANNINDDDGDVQYELRGVVNHLGTEAHAGHYTYHGRVCSADGLMWLDFNDARVGMCRKMMPHAVAATESVEGDASVDHQPPPQQRWSSSEAYMLVYHRIPSNNNSNTSTPTTTSSSTPTTTTMLMKREEEAAPQMSELSNTLRERVERNNCEAVRQRQTWARLWLRSQEMLRLWAGVATAMFHNTTSSSNSLTLDDVCAVPTSWLREVGRAFMSEEMVRRIMDGKTMRHGVAASVAATNDAAGEDDADTRWRRAEVVEDSLRRALDEMRCPHQCIAPMSDFKLIPRTSMVLMEDYLHQLRRDDGCDGARTPAHSLISSTSLSCQTCSTCVLAVAHEVVAMAANIHADEMALQQLRSHVLPHQVSEYDANNNNNDIIMTFANRDVLSTVADLAVDVEAWMELRISAGATAVVAALHSMSAGLLTFPAVHLLQQLFDAHEEDYDLASNMCCEHGQLPPHAIVSALPEDLRMYWVKRLPALLQCRPGVASSSSPTPSIMEELVVRRLLPHLPTSSISRCGICVADVATIHRQRAEMQRIKQEEAFHLPTLRLAGQLTTTSSLDALLVAEKLEGVEPLILACHPNRAVFRRPVLQDYQRHVRQWKQDQSEALMKQSQFVQEQQQVLVRLRNENAAWLRNVKTRSTRGRGAANNNNNNNKSDGSPTRVDAAVSGPVAEAEQRLSEAERVLQELRSQVDPPPLEQRFGCLPMTWVAAWYAHLHAPSNTDDAPSSSSSTPPSPPRVDVKRFLCPHGGSLMDPAWLNPADVFWQGTRPKRAAAMWPTTTTTSSTQESMLVPEMRMEDDARLSIARSYPPLLLVPMEEFRCVMEKYGPAEWMANNNNNSNNNNKDSSMHTPPSCLILLERNGERVMEPPLCHECQRCVLSTGDDAAAHFINGSLPLQLHIRRSKRQFYDARGLLTSVAVCGDDVCASQVSLHHHTTLAELKVAVCDHLMIRHGWIVPADELDILRGRKPLKRRHVLNASSHATTTTNNNKSELNDATLLELGIHDGDTLTVNCIDVVAQPCAVEKHANNNDEWEKVPAELLNHQAGAPSSTSGVATEHAAFQASRLLDATSTTPTTAHGMMEEANIIACSVCTFANAPGMVVCEMCDSPLPTH